MTMITPSYLGETIEYSSLHACRSTLEDPTMEVGAIHGRLLTAWSVAGICGPVLVNYIREYEKNRGVALADSYSTVLYVMVGLLIVGLIANALVRPVNSKYWYQASATDQQAATA